MKDLCIFCKGDLGFFEKYPKEFMIKCEQCSFDDLTVLYVRCNLGESYLEIRIFNNNWMVIYDCHTNAQKLYKMYGGGFIPTKILLEFAGLKITSSNFEQKIKGYLTFL
jgi:hypothetical protein